MITTFKNEEGFVYAYIEWSVVDHQTRLDDKGEFLYIRDLWIHPRYRGNGVLGSFMKVIFYDPKTQRTQFVYWNNNKHHRLSGLVPISRFLNKL